MEKDVGADEEDEESNMEPKDIKEERKEHVLKETEGSPEEGKDEDKEEDNNTAVAPGTDKPSGEPVSSTALLDENAKPLEPSDPEKPLWPFTTDLNTRIRKLITAFQRYFKKEEIKNAQKAKVIY